MPKMLYALVDNNGEFIIGGTSSAKRNSKKPHVYTNERSAKLGAHHVDCKAEDVSIATYVPKRDLLYLLNLVEQMLPYVGSEIDVTLFDELLLEYGYYLTDDGYIERAVE